MQKSNRTNRSSTKMYARNEELVSGIQREEERGIVNRVRTNGIPSVFLRRASRVNCDGLEIQMTGVTGGKIGGK